MSSTQRRAVVSGTGLVSLTGLLLLTTRALAGDPAGVHATLGGIQGNWPQAQLSIDVMGIKDSSVQVDHPLQIQYEAAGKGYLTWLRVSSHGEIYAGSPAPGTLSAEGTISLPVASPLGHEQLLFLFSDKPLTGLGAAVTDQFLGADRDDAQAVVDRLQQLKSQGVLLAARRIDYQVEAPPGQTQYTTRSIIRTLAQESTGGVHAAPRFPTRIEFEFDSDRLTANGKRDLDVFGQAILDARSRQVTLEGHTDAIGSDQYNMQLSLRRAAAVQRYLVDSFGLPNGQLKVAGKGKTDPVASNETAEGRSQNRRVDFIFEGK